MKTKSPKKQKKKVNSTEVIVNAILEQLEKGEIPWEKPWSSQGRARNLVSKKEYRGVNQLLLSMMSYDCPVWATFKQIKSKGGNVKKGQKGTPVMLWKFFKVEDKETTEDNQEETEEKKEKQCAVVRHYTVFNLEQCEGIEIPKPEVTRVLEDNNKADEIIKNYFSQENCSFKFGGDRAYYSPSLDHVQIPNRCTFKGDSQYYCTTFHEMVHSTGHKERLSRKEATSEGCLPFFGSEDYSQEELVAEIGAWLLSGECGFTNKIHRNTVAYCQAWIKKLKDNKKCLLVAGSRAEKAVAYILQEK